MLLNLYIFLLFLVIAKIKVKFVSLVWLLIKIEIIDVVTTDFIVPKVEGLVIRGDLLLDLNLLLDGLHPLKFVVLSCHSRELHDSPHLGVHVTQVVFLAIVIHFWLVDLLLWLPLGFILITIVSTW